MRSFPSFQFAGGVLSSRFGGKLVLAFAVVVWSAFTIMTPAAAGVSVAVLFATRVLMGMGEVRRVGGGVSKRNDKRVCVLDFFFVLDRWQQETDSTMHCNFLFKQEENCNS